MDETGSPPTEVFDLVGNPTRLEILRALADAYGERPDEPWLAYNELREAVGVRDNGNFNYHIDRLGDLVVKREGGYMVSRIGLELVAAVSSGTLDTEWTWGPVDAPGDCLFCDSSVRLRYEDGVLWLACGRDDHRMGLSVPPSLLDSRPEEDAIERIAFMENRWGSLVRQGICSECGGYVDGQIVYGGVQPDHYHFRGHCDRCGYLHGLPLGLFLVDHPAVTNFYYERGVDIRTTPFWTLDFCTPGSETVLSTDPLRLQVDVTHDGDTLSLTVEQDGSVAETTGSA